MKRRALIGHILIYILQPEDTSTVFAENFPSSLKNMEINIIRVRILKAIFWTIIAIITPIGFVLITH
ncbi:hypothetical protein [Desulfopila aestuarii]|uniref:Uncharacterized protein n=1 Tax=Desulfopila aestuarii DSM 18488 TaxID=1121416 RepID=A0A1M7XWM8_9BACT|nr:hypothetical protein [Desulfopila aestuarii]SHO43203.1 hypothetical protein SAMN02745220_00333 [Desulfopila aestuarii DSM 18488]